MSTSKAIELTTLPKDEDYEDYLGAYLQAGGLYVERRIIQREVEELLELDLITTNFQKDSADNLLLEFKSGDWGFSDIFKIRGWMTYLNYNAGCFMVQRTRPSITYFRDKAKDLGIDLIDNSNLEKTAEVLGHLLLITPKETEIEAIRFAYLLERKMLRNLKNLKKNNRKTEKPLKCYDALDDYFFKINSGSFFSRDPVRRINQLFDTYRKYRNISAKICNELNGGSFDNEDVTELSENCFNETFYKANNNIFQISLYVEHMARLTILKCVIEHIIEKNAGNYDLKDFGNMIEFSFLPENIKSGIESMISDPYFYLYPRFWQFFTYVFGGFILTEFEEQEHQLLSEKTGIPIEEIPNAFKSFNKLFPRTNGWAFNIPYTDIRWHNFFPIAFSGIGANYRRYIHTDNESYDDLREKVSKDMTMNDLSKWNNLGYQILTS